MPSRAARSPAFAEIGLPDPPYPEGFILMGDFNMLTGSPEYVELVGRPDHDSACR